MCDKRSQGRPYRGGNEVGSEKIVESLRNMLRSRRFEPTSRKQLAEYAGVTPALITYYFPSKEGLIEQATKPIIEDYAQQLRSILQADDEPDIKLKLVISLLVRCYERDAGIFDAYSELVRKKGGTLKPNYIDLMSQELSDFFGQWCKNGRISVPHPTMLQGALWGMCQFVAQTKFANDNLVCDADDLPSELDRVTPIYDLITGGLDRWGVCA